MIKPQYTSYVEKHSENEVRFVFEPLTQSFAHSMGNALRRTLLSSLEGAAITHVKIEGAPHLFMTLEGVKESMLDVVMNMKLLRFEEVDTSDGHITVNLNYKGKGIVTGKDFEGEVKVVNGDLYIAEVTGDQTTLSVEALVETNVGYVLAEDREGKNGYITLDSAFSPVKRVAYHVEEARVGRVSNYEKLIMDVVTDGSIDPETAMKRASDLLVSHFNHILVDIGNLKREGEEASISNVRHQGETGEDIIIDELTLPSRVINALLRENIETVADLVKRGKESLSGLKGVGKKSVELIEEELKRLNIELK